MKKFCTLAILGLISSTHLFAEDAGDLERLQQSLDEATEIATKTKINIDYVPSVVSVQRGDKLKLLGANSVYDALEMLPGIQMQINQLGQVETVVRGFKNPNSAVSDKIKVLLDGVAVGSETFGTAGYVMNFPLELVDRIEVLRGPGSTLYGSGAFYGAVNIITKSNIRSDCGEAFAGVGSWEYRKFGAIGCTMKNGTKYSTDGYYQGSDRKLQADKTYTNAGRANITFPRDFTTSEGFYDYSAGFTMEKDDFSWSTRLKKSRQGNYYGKEERLEPTTDTGQTNQFLSSELKYKGTTSLGTVTLVAGAKDYAYQMDEVYNDSSWKNQAGSSFDYNYADTYKIAETTIYTSAGYSFKKIYSHKISLSADASYTKIRENYFRSNLEDFAFSNPSDPVSIYWITHQGEASLQSGVPKNNLYLQSGTTRSVVSVLAEDIYELSDWADLTVGLRDSKTSDLDTKLDYRIGLVARWLDDSLISKLMYSTGYRAPNFAEKYTVAHVNFEAGDSTIKPEEIKSYEATIIYKPNHTHRFSVNGYYSEILNVIDIEQNNYTYTGYQQYPKRISKGLELEYGFTPNATHELSINASFNKTTYMNTDGNPFEQDMPDISPVMYKAWYLYRPINILALGIKYQYIGKTTQNQATDRTTSLPAQQKIDLNLKYKISNSTALGFYIDNILNTTQRMPTYFYRNVLSSNSSTDVTNSGMTREGRNFLVEIAHKF